MSSNYGVCINCKAEMPTQDDARAHMTATRPEGSGQSHAIHVLNPPREDVIRGRVASVVGDAVLDAMDDLDRLTQTGYDYTDAEIRSALSGYPDFADAWDEYTREVTR